MIELVAMYVREKLNRIADEQAAYEKSVSPKRKPVSPIHAYRPFSAAAQKQALKNVSRGNSGKVYESKQIYEA